MTSPTPEWNAAALDTLRNQLKVANYKSERLSGAERAAWDQTLVRFTLVAPAFAPVLYQCLSGDPDTIAVFTRAVPIAATDGRRVYLNPDTYLRFPIEGRLLVLCHEILHVVFEHVPQARAITLRGKLTYSDGASLPYDPSTANQAMDYIINDLLLQSGLGALPVLNGKTMGLHDTTLGTADDQWGEVYRKLVKQGGGGDSASRQSFDVVITEDVGQGAPGQTGSDGQLPGQGVSQGVSPSGPTQSEIATAVAQGIASAKAMGKLPAALERVLGQIVTPPGKWQDKIRGFFARKVGAGGYDWMHADEELLARPWVAQAAPAFGRAYDIGRQMIAPSRSGAGVGCVVVAVDTSGSIGKAQLDAFFAEMAGIVEDVQPRRLVVMWCDARVDRVDEVEEASDLTALRAKPVPGGGGTDFRPVFSRVVSMGLEPDALVYLTDGLGTFPSSAPAYPVLWGSIYSGASYPWGDVVDLTELVK